MYAKSFHTMPSKNIINISNQISGEYEFPSLEYLYKHRVVICTLNTAGCISRARNLDKRFNSSHFSHLFIDEAASVQMSVALVSIFGMYILRIKT